MDNQRDIPEEGAPGLRAGWEQIPSKGMACAKALRWSRAQSFSSCCGRASTARKGQVGQDGTGEEGGGQDGQPPQAMLEIIIFIITSMSRQGAVSSQVNSG